MEFQGTGDRQPVADIFRAPFVFTKDFAYVISQGSKNFSQNESIREFIDLCCTAYHVLRKNAFVFINLFSLVSAVTKIDPAQMLSTGIPELQSDKDIEHLKDSLCLSKSDTEAKAFFTDLIWKSLASKATSVNFFVHNVAQKMRK